MEGQDTRPTEPSGGISNPGQTLGREELQGIKICHQSRPLKMVLPTNLTPSA